MDQETDFEARSQDRDFVSSLAKGLAVIQTFGPNTRRMTLSEVANRTQLTRAASRRLLLTLETLGFVRRHGREFELAPKVLDLGFAFLASHNFMGMAQASLEVVTETLQESCSLGVLEGQEVVYVARSAAEHRLMSISLSVGSRLPAVATSMGRVLLAHLEESARRELIEKIELKQYTQRTITDKDQLREILQAVRRDGYCIVDQELEPSLLSIAVPVRTMRGQVAASVNISANAGRIGAAEVVEQFLPPLLRCAAAIKPFMT